MWMGKASGEEKKMEKTIKTESIFPRLCVKSSINVRYFD